MTAMVLLWAARLGSFLVKRVHAVGKDSRFDKMRDVLVSMFLVFSLSVGRRLVRSPRGRVALCTPAHAWSVPVRCHQAVWGFLCLLPVFIINGFR